MRLSYDVDGREAVIPTRDHYGKVSEIRYKLDDDTFWAEGKGVTRDWLRDAMKAFHKQKTRALVEGYPSKLPPDRVFFGRHISFTMDSEVAVALLAIARHFRKRMGAPKR